VPTLFTINKPNETLPSWCDAYLTRTSVRCYRDYAFDRSVEGYRARPLHLHVCQVRTAMCTSDIAYSKRSFNVSFRSMILYFSSSAMLTRMCQCGVGHVSFIDPSSVSRGARIAHSERAWEIAQLTDTMCVPSLKRDAISISFV